MKSNKLIIPVLAVILALSAGSCKNKEASGQIAQDPIPVIAYTARTENVVYYNSYPATVTALNEIQLRSEVNGYITRVFFTEGTHVNKGSRLYEIDRKKYQAAFEAAKANVEIATSNLEKSQRDAGRYQKLDEQNAIAKQILDDGLTGLENAKMQLKLANANLLNAETDYNYSLITAPFSGMTGFSFVKPGAFVAAGQTLLTTISSDDPVGVDFSIDQNSLPYMLKVQQTKVSENDSIFKIALPDNSDYKYNGELSVIDRAIDPVTGTIKVRVVFPNEDGNLRPGMNCKIKIKSEDSGLHVVIPVRATIEQMSENLVYIIEEGKVSLRRITPGVNLGGFVVVEEGLKDGDRIILEGLQNVREGSMVSIEEPKEALERVSASPSTSK
ncbi:MAG: efflux RND transporter periplasmic adaptor subunit [Bacteroidales bacterium]